MPSITAKTSDVITKVRSELTKQARKAAGGDTSISKKDEKKMEPGLLREVVAEQRSEAPGRSVKAAQVAEAAATRVEELLAEVNQRGPTSVSQSEVKQLAQRDAGAGHVVARAYEMITGKKIELPTDAVAPIDPTPPGPTPAGTAIAVRSAALTPIGDDTSGDMKLDVLADGTLQIKGRAAGPHELKVKLAGRTITVPPTDPAGHPLWRGREVIERLRAAAPDLDVRVTKFTSGKAVVDFWPAGTAPAPEHPPVFITAAGFEKPGPLSINVNGPRSTPLSDGQTFTLVVDNQRFDARTGGDINNVADVLYEWRRQLRAIGLDADVKIYGDDSYGSFKVKPGQD